LECQHKWRAEQFITIKHIAEIKRDEYVKPCQFK